MTGTSIFRVHRYKIHGVKWTEMATGLHLLHKRGEKCTYTHTWKKTLNSRDTFALKLRNNMHLQIKKYHEHKKS